MEYLLKHALNARAKARVPYSNFPVGAAVECEDGTIFHGANIEGGSSSVTECAERLAISQAILSGKTPKTIAIIADTHDPVSPCGICRQFMVDFSPLDVIMSNLQGDTAILTAKQLLPVGYHRTHKNRC